jgi:hypothetical protein
MPAPFSSVYSATKTGIKGLMSGLQSEYSVYPEIHICNVYPQVQQSTGNMHSAKFSGLNFKIFVFSSNPKDTAKVIYNLIDKPKNDTFPDATSFMLKLAHGAFPETFTNLATGVLRLMMKVKKGKADEGNILYASSDPHQIYGETSIPVPSKSTQRIVSLGILIGLGLYTTTRIRRKYK